MREVPGWRERDRGRRQRSPRPLQAHPLQAQSRLISLSRAGNQQDGLAGMDERSGRAGGEETEEKQDADHSHTRKSAPLQASEADSKCCQEQEPPVSSVTQE